MSGGAALDSKKKAIASRAWMWMSALLIAVGVILSAYSLQIHLKVKSSGSSLAACNINATVTCDEVTRSEYGEVLGFPLGVWGIGYFAAQAVLLVLVGLGLGSTASFMLTLLVLAALGVIASLALAGISFFILKAVCLACVGIYVTNLLQALSLWWFRSKLPATAPLGLGPLLAGGLPAALVFVLTPAAYLGMNSAATAKPVPATPQTSATMPAPKENEIPFSFSPYSDLGEDYHKGGDENAKVILIEFSDFGCPACKTMANRLKEIVLEYDKKVALVFKNFPLDIACNRGLSSQIHPFSCKTAMVARCAGQYGKFWEFHDIVFANQSNMSDAAIKKWAAEVGLTEEQVSACLKDKSLADKIEADISLANQLQVNSTPTVYINGQMIDDLALLKAEIERTLVE